MPRILICAAIAAASFVTEAQAPRHYTAYDFVSDMVDQCVEDAECGSDTDCILAEDECVREITQGGR